MFYDIIEAKRNLPMHWNKGIGKITFRSNNIWNNDDKVS